MTTTIALIAFVVVLLVAIFFSVRAQDQWMTKAFDPKTSRADSKESNHG